jgi:hypothetical protein
MVCGCSGGNDAGSVSGTVHGKTIAVGDSNSAAVTILGQHFAGIVLTSSGNQCADLGTRVEHPNEQAVAITLADVAGLTFSTPTVPGTYAIYQSRTQAPPKAATLQVLVDDTNCSRIANQSATATSGTVTITSISGNHFGGKFDVVVDSTDHITGTFAPTECPGIQTYYDNLGSAAASCQ